MSKEIWKDVVDYEGLYMVSNKARLKSLNFNKTKKVKLMSVGNKKNGYCVLTLYKNRANKNKLLHRLVAIAFIPNPLNKPCVNHLRGVWVGHGVDNLEWATYSENELHSFKILGKIAYQPMKGKYGKDHNRSKGVSQYSLDGKLISTYGSSYEALRATKISQGNIGSCIRGERHTAGGYIWKYTNPKQ